MQGNFANASRRWDGANMIEVRVHIEPCGLSRDERITLLCGQLKLLRLRAEQGILVSEAALARTEQLARTLEAAEARA
jgi:hypothetical protein